MSPGFNCKFGVVVFEDQDKINELPRDQQILKRTSRVFQQFGKLPIQTTPSKSPSIIRDQCTRCAHTYLKRKSPKSLWRTRDSAESPDMSSNRRAKLLPKDTQIAHQKAMCVLGT